MREFEFTFMEGLHVGLRKLEESSRSDQALVECLNSKITEFGLLPFEPMSDVLNSLQDEV